MLRVIAGLLVGGLIALGHGAAMAQQGDPYEAPSGDPYYGDPYVQHVQTGFGGNASILVGGVWVFPGGKTLDDFWIPEVSDQAEFAVLFDMKGQFWPVSLAVDMRVSVGETFFDGISDVHATTSELNVGVRQIMDTGGPFRPYFGGGLSMASIEVIDDFSGVAVLEDSGTGYWLGIGAYFDMSQNLHLGLDLAWSEVDAGVGPIGGQHFGLMLGYHWR